MFDIVTVPNFLVPELPNRHLADIEFYFQPDIYLVPDTGNPDTPKLLANTTGTRVIAPRLLANPTPYYFDDEILLIVPYLDGLEDLRNTSFDRPTHIITGFLEEDYDFSTFSHTVANISAYRDVVASIDAPELTHFTIEVPAGDKLVSSEFPDPIHGISWVEGRAQNPTRYIPKSSITTTGDVNVEHLRSDRLGIQAIYQLGSKYHDRLQSNDFTRRADLLGRDVDDLLQVPGIGGYNAAAFIAGANAIQDNTLYRFDEIPYTGRSKAFIDIETDSLQPEVIWQIGIYNEPTDQYASILQKDPDARHEIIEAFGDWLCQTNVDTLVAWNGNDFDFPHLKDFLDEYGTPAQQAAWDDLEKVDLKTEIVQNCAALPSRTWTLSAIASRLGFDWTRPGLGGEAASETYTEWMHGGEEPDWDAWRQYCRDDVLAMKHIYDALQNAETIVERDELETRNRELTRNGGLLDFEAHGSDSGDSAGENLTLDAFGTDTPAEGADPESASPTDTEANHD